MAEERKVWRRTWKPDLSFCPWIPFCIEGKNFLIKSQFSSESYTALVFDGEYTWAENTSQDYIKIKAKAYNPNIEAPVSKLLQHLKECLQHNSTKAQLQVHYKEDASQLQVHVSSHLTGRVPFKWKIEGSKNSNVKLSEQITTPLLCMVSELLQREKALVSILTRKDTEIEDLKASGAKSSRKHLETTPFNQKAFQEQRVHSTAFEEIVSKSGIGCFQVDGQSLYKEIMLTTAWMESVKSAEEIDDQGGIADTLPVDPVEHQSPSRANKVPLSLLEEAASAGSSPASHHSGSRNTSPKKLFSPGRQEEEDELLRREALERKLEQEKMKQQHRPKKKKKLF